MREKQGHTFYLSVNLVEVVRKHCQETKESLSRWIEEAIRRRLETEVKTEVV